MNVRFHPYATAAMLTVRDRVCESASSQRWLNAITLREAGTRYRDLLPCQRESDNKRGPNLKDVTYMLRDKLGPDGQPIRLGSPIARPDDISTLLWTLLEHEAVEVFGVLCLTTRRRIICWHEVSRGNPSAAFINPRDVFRAAISVNATAVITAHNHPSGEATPSPDDIRATKRLVTGGSLLGVDLLDHFIVGQDGCVSLAASGAVDFRVGWMN
jgi:DNA repair protein RadC